MSIYDDIFANGGTDRVQDVRYVGAINGCYTLPGRPSSGTGVEVFACRSQAISTKRILLGAPVPGKIGSAVRIKLDEFEIIHGRIINVADGRIDVDIEATAEERTKIAAKIDWIKKRKFRAMRDKRADKRIMLANPRSAITLADASVVECFVIDVSSSGAAVSAEISPPIGTKLTVGRVTASVVRHKDVGFAVQFETPISLNDLESAFALSENQLPAADNAEEPSAKTAE